MREQERSDELAGLWEAYRGATPAPEASVNFMPELWTRIETARPTAWVQVLTRLAYRLAPVAAAVILVLGMLAWPGGQNANDPAQGYVDVLVADLLAGAEDGGLQ